MEGRKKKPLYYLIIWTICRLFGISFYGKRAILEIDPSRYGLEYERVSFYSRGNKKKVLLRGWYVPAKNKEKCIIMVHGWGSNRTHPETGLLEIAKELVNHGYNVLTFDLRAHGESGGKRVSLGYYEVHDVLGARDFVINKKKIPPRNIGLMGFSYGAMISIFAARKEGFGAVVADSSPGDTFGLIKRTLARLHILPLFRLLKFLFRKLFEADPDELNIIEAVKSIPIPIFFIHGKKDNLPYADIQRLYQIKKRNSLDRIWITNAFHTEAYKTFPKKYLKKIIKFFNEALKPAP